MPNEKPNATRTDRAAVFERQMQRMADGHLPNEPLPPAPEDGDPEYTIEVKRQEIVSCLKYLAILAIQNNALECARGALGAAELVDDLNLESLADAPWTGL